MLTLTGIAFRSIAALALAGYFVFHLVTL